MTSEEIKAAAEHLRRWDAGECPSAIYPDATDPIEAADNDAWDLSREFRKHLAADEQQAERIATLERDEARAEYARLYDRFDLVIQILELNFPKRPEWRKGGT